MAKSGVRLDIDFTRTHFPALSGDWALFENAGGTLAANTGASRKASA